MEFVHWYICLSLYLFSRRARDKRKNHLLHRRMQLFPTQCDLVRFLLAFTEWAQISYLSGYDNELEKKLFSLLIIRDIFNLIPFTLHFFDIVVFFIRQRNSKLLAFELLVDKCEDPAMLFLATSPQGHLRLQDMVGGQTGPSEAATWRSDRDILALRWSWGQIKSFTSKLKAENIPRDHPLSM